MSIAQGLRKVTLVTPATPGLHLIRASQCFRSLERRSTAVWPLIGQVARMAPLVGEGYGNRRDRPLVEYDGAKVAHAIRLRDGYVSAASALGSQKRRIGWVVLAILTFIILCITQSIARGSQQRKGRPLPCLRKRYRTFVERVYCAAGEVDDNYN